MGKNTQKSKDQEFMNQLSEQAMKGLENEKKKMMEKKKKMQEINKERSEHQKLLIQEWQKDRQQLSEYQKGVIQQNREKEEADNKKRMDAFMARKVNAQTNIEKFNKLKLDKLDDREAEKRKFSPVNSNKLKEASLLKTGFDMTSKME